MNQKLSDWASLAEIVSGLAVVVTLVFLVVGIRDNTSTTRAAVYGDLLDGVNELEYRRLDDPQWVLMWGAFRDGNTDDLDDIDYSRLALYVQILARNYEKAYFDNKYGVIGDSEWDRFRGAICRAYMRSERAGFRVFSFSSTSLSMEFLEYAQETCDPE